MNQNGHKLGKDKLFSETFFCCFGATINVFKIKIFSNIFLFQSVDLLSAIFSAISPFLLFFTLFSTVKICKPEQGKQKSIETREQH